MYYRVGCGVSRQAHHFGNKVRVPTDDHYKLFKRDKQGDDVVAAICSKMYMKAMHALTQVWLHVPACSRTPR